MCHSDSVFCLPPLEATILESAFTPCIPVTEEWIVAYYLRAISSEAAHRSDLLLESHWNRKDRTASRTREPYNVQLFFFLDKGNIFVIFLKQKDREAGQGVGEVEKTTKAEETRLR